MDWIIGVGVELSDGGAPAKLKTLSDAARTASASFDLAQTAARSYALTIVDLGVRATAAAAGIEKLNAALRQSASAASAAGATRAASGYTRVAAAADLATVSAMRFNAASARGGALALSGGGGGMRNVTPGFGGSSSFGGGAAAYGFGRGAAGGSGGGGSVPPAGGGGTGGGGAARSFGVGELAVPGWVGRKALALGKDAMISGMGYGVDAIYEAAKLQTILTTTSNIIGANPKQMAQIRQASFDVGDKNAMSAVQVATMFREIARQSVGAFSIKDMIGLLPTMAKLQTVVGAARGFTAEKTVDNAMGIFHLMRAYDPKSQAKAGDSILRMSELMPDDLSRARTQMAYFAPTLKNMHVSDEDMATFMIFASRVGMAKGKGGTSLQNLFGNALGPLQATSHLQKGKAFLLGPKNLNVIDEHGKSRYFTDKGADPMGFLFALNEYSKKVGSIQAGKVMQGAFGIQGARMGDMFADKVIVEQLINIRKEIKDSKTLGLDAQAKSIYGTADFAISRSAQNFQSLATEIGSLALPGVTRGFTDLGNSLHDAQHWLHQHADLERKIQKAIIDGVVGVERYLVSHKKDWQDFGNDVLVLGKEVKNAAPDILRVADAIGKLYQQAKMFADDLHSLGDALYGFNDALGGKWLHDLLAGKTPSGPASAGGKGGGGGFDTVSYGGKGRLSSADIGRTWIEKGGDKAFAEIMGHVGFEESAGNVHAHNSYVERGKRYNVDGLFQVSDIHHMGSDVGAAIKLFNARRAAGGTGLEDWADSQRKGATGGWQQYLPGQSSAHVPIRTRSSSKATTNSRIRLPRSCMAPSPTTSRREVIRGTTAAAPARFIRARISQPSTSHHQRPAKRKTEEDDGLKDAKASNKRKRAARAARRRKSTRVARHHRRMPPTSRRHPRRRRGARAGGLHRCPAWLVRSGDRRNRRAGGVCAS